MKNFKKLLAFVIVIAVCAAFTAGLVACNNDGEGANKPSVVIISYETDIMDGSFNQLCWDSLRGCGEIKASYKEFKTENGKTFDEFLDGVIAEKPAAIFLMEERVKDAVIAKAAVHTDIMFGILDSSVKDTNLPENVATCTFAVEQSSYLAGYIAAKTAEAANKNKIGFIGGMDIGVINAFYYGYEAGAKYAVPGIEIAKEYVGDYADKVGGKDLATNMYNGGSYIIFQAAGEAGLGVIEAAKDLDKQVIGVDSDQSALAPGLVLTSVIKNMGDAIHTMAHQFAGGEKIGGKCFTFNLDNGGVGIVETSLSDALKAEIASLTAKITSGEIVVPSTGV